MDKGRLHLIFVNLWKWKAKDRECLKMMCKLLGRKTEWTERERESTKGGAGLGETGEFGFGQLNRRAIEYLGVEPGPVWK